MVMYCSVRSMYGYVLLCEAMYGYILLCEVNVWLCIAL